MGVREIAKAASEAHRKELQEQEEKGTPKNTGAPVHIPMGGERQQTNFKLSVDILETLDKLATRSKRTRTAIVEAALIRHLKLVCEECGK